MRLLGLVIGALVILASAISFAVPDQRLSLERSVMTPTGLYAIATLRIATVVRRCPRAGGRELVGECRAVLDAP